MTIDVRRHPGHGRTAFVLAGGGSLGAVEVGMLKALTDYGLRADLVVGSSVGAINSVFYAADPTADGISRLMEIWRGLRRQDVFPVSAAGVLWGVFGQRRFMLTPRALERLLEVHLPVTRLEATTLPVCVIATDVLLGSEVRLVTGPAVPALLASTAIPGLFPPVMLEDRLLVDGAVASHTPIAAARALGATRIVALPAGYPCARADAPSDAIGMALHGLNVITTHQLARDVAWHRQHVEVTVVPPLCPLAVASYEFTSAGEIMDRAALMTSAWLSSGGLETGFNEETLVPHHHP